MSDLADYFLVFKLHLLNNFPSLKIDQSLLREVHILSEKQKLLARYADTFGSISEISKTLDKIGENLSRTVLLLEKLNQQLPVEYQMAPFF